MAEVVTAPAPQRAAAPVLEARDYRLTVVVPAYNEAATIAQLLARVVSEVPDAEVIVVDDASADETAALAGRAGARVVRQAYNKGNGAAVKAGLRAATGEVVLLLDADGQHDPADIQRVLAPIGPYDMVIAARSRSSNASFARGWGNQALNLLGSYLTGIQIEDLTSGFRAMKRDHILEFIHLLPNRYSYPTTSTLAFIKAGYSVKFVPIEAQLRTGGASGQRLFQNGTRFFLIVLRMVTLFSPMKIFFPVSLVLFLLGCAYALYTIFTEVHITNSSVLLLTSSIVIFLMGLISEQIAALRFERRE